MTSRMLPLCFLTVSILPPASFGQSKSSLSSVDPATDVISVHELSVPDKARSAYNRGIHDLNARDWARSVPELQRAIKSFPGFYEAYDLLGTAELAMGDSTDAETAFQRSIDLSQGKYASPHFGLGLILCISHKRLADAEAIVREGLDLDPSDARGHFVLAWILYTAKQSSDAEQSAREALRYKPNFAEPYLLLAQIHLQLKSWSAAIEDLDGYLKVDPSSPRSDRMRSVRAAAQQALVNESGNRRAPITPK